MGRVKVWWDKGKSPEKGKGVMRVRVVKRMCSVNRREDVGLVSGEERR